MMHRKVSYLIGLLIKNPMLASRIQLYILQSAMVVCHPAVLYTASADAAGPAAALGMQLQP